MGTTSSGRTRNGAGCCYSVPVFVVVFTSLVLGWVGCIGCTTEMALVSETTSGFGSGVVTLLHVVVGVSCRGYSLLMPPLLYFHVQRPPVLTLRG